ncbi:CBS domain-containing protein [Frankia sp. AgKG'84/4]|uniref:CBS domain-containing protein n=1 Tax=Frankia sp. AgKG'84/4 TaxID=573490 RepID=UPI00200F4E84|nr:CBS domain-containing protein [Frankia sp. AgKG'84/4]MCL9797759.1 CBS domain-containing protein [Frankia sp. AgKG'84/4]
MAYVGSMISRPPTTVERSTTIANAAREMARTGVGALLVVDNEHLVGIVTDRDIVVRGLARGIGSDGRIDALMTTEVVTVPAGMGIERAYEIFRDHALRRLPVLDGRRIVGIVTVDDLLIRSQHELAELTRPLRDETFAPQHEAAAPVVVGAPAAGASTAGSPAVGAARRAVAVAGTAAALSHSAVFPRRTGVLRARPGDTLIVHSHVPRTPDRLGEIFDVRSEAGDPPFAVRWADNGHVSFVFPGPDAEIRYAGARPGHPQPA